MKKRDVFVVPELEEITPYRNWETEDGFATKLLKKYWSRIPTEKICRVLEKHGYSFSKGAIDSKARRLGLHRKGVFR